MTRGKQDKQANKALITLSVTHVSHEKDRMLNKKETDKNIRTYRFLNEFNW